MEITINVEDYVSQETIKEICEDAIKNCAREWARNEIAAHKNITTLFANAAYKETARMLAKTEPDFEEKIREKVRSVIEGLSSFTVFNFPSYYDSYKSEAAKIVEDEVKKNEQFIREKTKEIIADHMNQKNFIEAVAEKVVEAISNNFDLR